MNKNYIVLRIQQVIAVSFVTCLWTHPANAQLGEGFITIDPPQTVYTFAAGINNDRKIVGGYSDAAGTGHGFLRSEDGRFVTIDHPQAAKVKGGFTEANGINSAGLIVGDYCAALPCDGINVVKGYVLRGDEDKDKYDKDDFTGLEIPGHMNEYVEKINSEGDIVGCYHDNDLGNSMHGFVWDDGKVTAVPVPASMNTGINDHGAITGFYEKPGVQHSYLLRKGVRTPIDFPGAVSTSAQEINNYGRVVGWYVKKDNSYHGFLWQKGEFTSVDIPGAVNGTFVNGINSVGDIVGAYVDAKKTGHGFLLHWRDYEDKDTDDDDDH
jgi:probable HAF family extracellular repeat protein